MNAESRNIKILEIQMKRTKNYFLGIEDNGEVYNPQHREPEPEISRIKHHKTFTQRSIEHYDKSYRSTKYRINEMPESWSVHRIPL